MNRIAMLLGIYPRWAWGILGIAGIVIATFTWKADSSLSAQKRMEVLQTEAQRTAVEVMSSTLNGNLMGSITLLGLIDMDIKQEVQNGLLSINASIDGTLASVGASFGAEGVFVVGGDGFVKTSWDLAGKHSTGLDVRFRPYYQMSMKGKSSVYAAVSMARGDRSLYFTAPVFTERAKSSIGAGAIVARTNLDRVDKLMLGRFDIALLLSPQGVVFASNRSDWIGRLEGISTPQRLKSIRDEKRFGSLFDISDPEILPINVTNDLQYVDGRRYAVATADVDWQDPSGPWKLLVMEDLSKTAPLTSSSSKAIGVAVAFWLLAWMVMNLFKSRHAQNIAAIQLQHLAKQQEKELEYRRQLGAAMIRMQQSNSPKELCQSFLTDAHSLFGAMQGVVYSRCVDDDHMFLLQASFACNGVAPMHLSAGEGFLGQCAVDHQVRVTNVDSDGLWTIRSGLGSTQPSALVMAPVLHNDHVLGLVEIATLNSADKFAKESFQEFIHLLALNLQILSRNENSVIEAKHEDAYSIDSTPLAEQTV